MIDFKTIADLQPSEEIKRGTTPNTDRKCWKCHTKKPLDDKHFVPIDNNYTGYTFACRSCFLQLGGQFG